MEEWRDISDIEFYQVSSKGRVRSKDRSTLHKDGKTTTHKGRILKQGSNPKGYAIFYPTVRGKKLVKTVHRVVAKAFIENPFDKETVNHINCDKKDNRVENLEWMTNAENMRHAFDNGIYKKRDAESSVRMKKNEVWKYRRCR